MAIRAILYDHDGTLVDSETKHFQLWADVLSPLGVELSVEIYKQFHAGLPTPTNAQDIKVRYGLPHTVAELNDMKEQRTHEFLSNEKFPLMPGVAESIDFFRNRKLQLAVVTGAGKQGVTTSIGRHGLQEAFDEIVSADDVEKSKPAPDSYLLALKKLDIEAHECIAIEDTSHGAQAAQAAGIECVVVPNSMSSNHDFPYAVNVCDNIMQASLWIECNYDLDSGIAASV